MAYTLKNINLGEHDAKREVMKLSNFEEYFYDHNEISEKVLEPTIFTVLGKKGTGKTLLAELLKKKAKSEYNWFCKAESYKRFSLNELQALKNGAISTEEYIPIWKWIILIELSKLVLKNVSLEKDHLYDKLKKFLDENGFAETLDSFKTISITKEKNLNASWKGFGFSNKGTAEGVKQSYLSLIEPLEELLINLLANKETKYTILFDELDDKFDGSTNYANSIVCLLKVAEELNFKFYEENIKFKIIIFLRRDILKMLEYSDLNKIIEGSSIILDWGRKEEENSPLWHLITKKIKKSIPELEDMSHNEILKNVFRGPALPISSTVRISAPKYILTRTLLRPRDVVNFINKIKEKYKDSTYIKPEMILETEKNYSDYLKNEILDELVGHIDRESVLSFFTLLKNFGNTEFNLAIIKEYYLKNKKNYKEIDIEEVLRKLYLVGAIGSKTFNKNTGKYHYSWSYKEDESYLNLDNIFCIHNGLRKTLNLR